MSTEFNDQQLRQIYPDGIFYHYWTRARTWHVEDALRSYRNSKILEIGCGGGVMIRALRISGFDVIGCDLCGGEVQEGEQEYLFYETDVMELDPALLNEVEVVILLDVLEHIEKPTELLNQIYTRLPKLKEVMITLPARAELWSNFDEFNGHFLRYDLKTISQLEISGLKLIRAHYLFQLLYLPAWLTVKLRGGRAETINPPTGMFKSIHALIALILYVSSRVFAWFSLIPGTSIMVSYRVEKDS